MPVFLVYVNRMKDNVLHPAVKSYPSYSPNRMLPSSILVYLRRVCFSANRFSSFSLIPVAIPMASIKSFGLFDLSAIVHVRHIVSVSESQTHTCIGCMMLLPSHDILCIKTAKSSTSGYRSSRSGHTFVSSSFAVIISAITAVVLLGSSTCIRRLRR